MRSFKRGIRIQTKAAVVGAILLIIAVIVVVNITTVTVRADETQKYTYQSIQVETGDTLWSIAQDYCPKDVKVNDYIDSVREMNGIATDYITEGNYILIPIYE